MIFLKVAVFKRGKRSNTEGQQNYFVITVNYLFIFFLQHVKMAGDYKEG